MQLPLFAITGLLIPFVTSIPLDVDIHITDDAKGGDAAVPTQRHLQQILNADGSPSTTVGNPATFPETNERLTTTMSDLKGEQIPGWVFIGGDKLQARIHGSTFWSIKGKLGEKFPVDDALLDPLIFTLTHPVDFEGPFNGTISKREVSLTWVKSGASMKGRTYLDDYEFKGDSRIDWS